MASPSLTERAKNALRLAAGPGDAQILQGIALEGGRVPAKLLLYHGIGSDDIRGSIAASPAAWDVVGSAEAIARELQHDQIGTEHLMLALIEDAESGPSRLLQGKSVSPEQVRREIFEILGIRR